MAVQNYKDLIVWQKSMSLAKEIYRLANKLPKEELYGLTNQLKRAAVNSVKHRRRQRSNFKQRICAIFIYRSRFKIRG